MIVLLLVWFSAIVAAEAGCTCPSSYPYCYGSNKWCYKSSTSSSYSQTCAGSCTASCSNSRKCACPSSYPYCYGKNKWCYKSSSSSSYTTTCGGQCTSSGGTSSGGSCACPSSYPYCYGKNKWCYKSSHSSSYTSTCGGKCTSSGGGGTSRRRSGGSSCACPSSYPYCYAKSKWCYKSSSSSSYSRICAGKCTGNAGTGPAPSPPGASCKKNGWQCKSNWHIGSDTSADALDFTMWGNVRRCQVDAQFQQWDTTIASGTRSWFASRGQWPPHSPSSARPHLGENKWYSTGDAEPGRANAAWFSEWKLCHGDFPGCYSGKGVGHFTAMVWSAATKLGCYRNHRNGLHVCRYGGMCEGHCSPNHDFKGSGWKWGDCYRWNVYKPKRSLSTCIAKVEKCFGKTLKNKAAVYKYDAKWHSSVRLDAEETPSVEPAERSFSWIIVGMVSFVSVACLVACFAAGSKLRKSRQLYVLPDQELFLEADSQLAE